MYLYTDQTSSDMMYGEKTTPAHMYEGSPDFSAILEDMMRGAIPTNTKHVYPTIWKADEQLLNHPEQISIVQPKPNIWNGGNNNP